VTTAPGVVATPPAWQALAATLALGKPAAEPALADAATWTHGDATCALMRRYRQWRSVQP
jgi:hypothetical protein